MAFILEITYKSGNIEMVPLWSTMLSKEIKNIKENNKDITNYILVSDDPSEEECKFFNSVMKYTNYNLPKEYKPNRKRRL